MKDWGCAEGFNEMGKGFVGFGGAGQGFGNKVVRAPQVQVGENASSSRAAGTRGSKYGNFTICGVQGAVIHAGPQASILLSHEEEAGGGR